LFKPLLIVVIQNLKNFKFGIKIVFLGGCDDFSTISKIQIKKNKKIKNKNKNFFSSTPS
jgi:hypothetical protein